MKEQIIEFYTAKLAKDKGFDWKVTHHYRDGGHYEKELIYGGSPYNMNDEEEQKLWSINLYSAPTQSLLQKWLRDEHGIDIEIEHIDRVNWCYKCGREYSDNLGGYQDFKTYEEALEAGLLESLKLI